jgi:hypothetical protein
MVSFDKLWSPGFFYKLLKTLSEQDWFISKQYYDIYLKRIYSMCVNVGGVLSPFLLNVSFDELIEMCISLNRGNMIFDLNTSLVSFCDDLNVISPPVPSQKLLDVCFKWVENWKMKFNSKKFKVFTSFFI